MKNYKKTILLISLVLLLVLIAPMIQIYAKYLSSARGNAEISVAKWNILVNNLSVKNNTDISSTIVPVFPGTSNISSNIIAPTAEGYFDLTLDYTDADVSFEYNISTTVSENSSVTDLVTTGYSIDGGDKVTFDNYNETISDTIPLTSQNKQRTIRIYVLWNDDDTTAEMSNSQDTLATTSENPAMLDVIVSFTQVK